MDTPFAIAFAIAARQTFIISRESQRSYMQQTYAGFDGLFCRIVSTDAAIGDVVVVLTDAAGVALPDAAVLDIMKARGWEHAESALEYKDRHESGAICIEHEFSCLNRIILEETF